MPKPEQVADFFKRRVVCKFVDIDAAVCEHSFIAIDITNAGCGGDYSF
jgi:hypothetical protein